MEAATATEPRVLIHEHTHLHKEYDPESGCREVVGYETVHRTTCRLHGRAADWDSRDEALRMGRDPADWCAECLASAIAEGAWPENPGSEVSGTDLEAERMERHPREGRCA